MARKVALVLLLSWTMLMALPAYIPAACDGCEPVTTASAAETGEGATGDEQDEQINPGIFVLALVLISIAIATVMLMRQSKPGLPEGYDDDIDDGTSGDQDTSSR